MAFRKLTTSVASPYWRSVTPLVAATSQAGPSQSVAFSTSSHLGAAAKGGAKGGNAQQKQKQKQKKGVVRSSSAGGSRAGAKKGRKGGAGGSGSSTETGLGFLRASQYAQQKPSMSSLPEFVPERLTADNLHTVMAYSQRMLDAASVKGFGVPKTLARQFLIEPRPKSLFRPHTLEVLDLLDKVQSSEQTSSESQNILFDAQVGFGVSTLLLQAFSYALESSWLTVYLPRSTSFVNSSSPYAYSDVHQTYLQPELTRDLLQRILLVNRDVLAKVTLGDETSTLPDGTGKLEKGTPLNELIQQSLRPETTPDTLQSVFEAVMRNIVRQRDVPVLLAIDGLQALFSTSWYRDRDFKQLQSYELSIPRTLQACLRQSGPGSFGGLQRGVALTAQSLSNKLWPTPPEMRLSLGLKPHADVYVKTDETMRAMVDECQFRVWSLANAVLTRQEAGALMNVRRAEGGMWSAVNDEMLMNKLVESGGNLAVFQRSLQGSLL